MVAIQYSYFITVMRNPLLNMDLRIKSIIIQVQVPNGKRILISFSNVYKEIICKMASSRPRKFLDTESFKKYFESLIFRQIKDAVIA